MTLTNIDTAMSAYRESTRDARFVPVERISPIRRADRGPSPGNLDRSWIRRSISGPIIHGFAGTASLVSKGGRAAGSARPDTL